MPLDSLDSAERRWRSRPLFRRQRNISFWRIIALLVLSLGVAGALLLYFQPECLSMLWADLFASNSAQ